MTYNMILLNLHMALASKVCVCSGGGVLYKKKLYYFTATSCSCVLNAQTWNNQFSVKVGAKQVLQVDFCFPAINDK